MSQIKLKHSGGNGVIIAAPSSNPAADRTLLLPGDGDSTIDTLGRAGNILQVVQDFLNTTVAITSVAGDSTTFTDTGLSATITPTSTSSKIFILATIYHSSLAATNTARFNIVRDSTNIAQPASGSGGNDGTTIMYLNIASMITFPMCFVDSPSTTSATTYKIQLGFDSPSGNTVHYLNRYFGADQYRGTSTLTLIEVSG
tara:strand:+ start:869 stop:1468 length:600 start_codon:yes stop_codon:yes gene_type:complete